MLQTIDCIDTEAFKTGSLNCSKVVRLSDFIDRKSLIHADKLDDPSWGAKRCNIGEFITIKYKKVRLIYSWMGHSREVASLPLANCSDSPAVCHFFRRIFPSRCSSLEALQTQFPTIPCNDAEVKQREADWWGWGLRRSYLVALGQGTMLCDCLLH